MDEQRNDPASPLETSREMIYKGRRVTIREGGAGCRVLIDEMPMHVERHGPGSYHSHILMYQDFPTAEKLAKALVDSEGTLWLLPKSGEHGHPHGGNPS